MSSKNKDTTNFWHNTEYDEVYWDRYLAARPKYDTCNFYDRVFAYHDAHSGSYDTAHDIGTGPGQVARILASRFQEVIASDPNVTHVDICRRRNAATQAEMQFLLSSAEELPEKVPPGSADAIFVGEALALMDPEAALRAFGRVLKPGGTLAIWFYGRPAFADGDWGKCQALYDKIITKLTGAMIRGGGPKSTAGWKRATDMMASWFDNVAFPAESWENVERYKWNTDSTLVFYDKEACDFPIETSSMVTEDEKVSNSSDEDFWAEYWNLSEVRRFIEVNVPGIYVSDKDPEVEAWYEELELAMGGKEAKRKISWPVALLLATNK